MSGGAATLGWKVRRLRQMSGEEIAARVGDRCRQAAWGRVGASPLGMPRRTLADRPGPAALPAGTREAVDPMAAAALIAAADRVLSGRWVVLGVERADVCDPDWFLDPITGVRAPDRRRAPRIDHRDEQATGNVKQVWELSRHHHLTVLAAAYWLTGEEIYAACTAAGLRSWWAANEPMRGVHWTSGIELGIRLISWTWIRRLLADWPGVEALYAEGAGQLWWHQRYLAAFPSRGTSSNNHAVAEAAGLLVASCAFPWFPQSAGWRGYAADMLRRTLIENTFDSGLNREQASDYHRFVTELGLVAAVEADASGVPLPEETWRLLAGCVDAAAAVADVTGRPPRQGDGDEGRGLLLDDPELGSSWAQLLAAGAALTGATAWWEPPVPSVGAVLLAAMAPGRRTAADRADARPQSFLDAGMTVLRSAGSAPAALLTDPDAPEEIWCRCDAGPHGLPGIAAHAHADALSVEVRHDGVDILADPGTYCYHGSAPWRRYFRSTLGHNTIELDGLDQSVSGGPFLWTRSATAAIDAVGIGGESQTWVGHHDGYERLGVRHDRVVSLDVKARRLAIVDVLTAAERCRRPIRMAFHLGPAVSARLEGAVARLSWAGRDGRLRTATFTLPTGLTWTSHTGETDPILGWYSPRFGERVTATTLLGEGTLAPAPGGNVELCSSLHFHGTRPVAEGPVARPQIAPRPIPRTTETN
ncbi:alginate lyase family protein [Nocardioides sp. BP30]|uniref:alginate lyase family protein n=1 Tax=Nocardioides sp. BP30 TaxID=3036374 RepID=UPI002468579E|nr:alginate lyase family protein [Nocardioides sp. BP30]WGL53314.1 alginate lyase family protein [Nocardioides sp. BP30]